MDQITVNGKDVYNVERDEKGSFLVDSELLDLDIKRVNDHLFHILHNNKSFVVELLELNVNLKTAKFKVNNEILDLQLKDKFDLLLEKLGMSDLLSKKISEVKAPMPGVILKILVEEGDEIHENSPLLVLEAMKMENIIKSPVDGSIKSIDIKEGDSVEKNHKLIQFN